MPYRLAVRCEGDSFGCFTGELFQDLLPIIKCYKVKVDVEVLGCHNNSE